MTHDSDPGGCRGSLSCEGQRRGRRIALLCRRNVLAAEHLLGGGTQLVGRGLRVGDLQALDVALVPEDGQAEEHDHAAHVVDEGQPDLLAQRDRAGDEHEGEHHEQEGRDGQAEALAAHAELAGHVVVLAAQDEVGEQDQQRRQQRRGGGHVDDDAEQVVDVAGAERRDHGDRDDDRELQPGGAPRDAVLVELHGFGTMKYSGCSKRSTTASARRHVNAYRHDYNHVRPHEAIAWNRPADVYAGTADPTVPNFETKEILPTT